MDKLLFHGNFTKVFTKLLLHCFHNVVTLDFVNTTADRQKVTGIYLKTRRKFGYGKLAKYACFHATVSLLIRTSFEDITHHTLS